MKDYYGLIQQFEESTRSMPIRTVVKIMRDAKKRIRKGKEMTPLQLFLLMKQREMQMGAKDIEGKEDDLPQHPSKPVTDIEEKE